MVSERMRRQLDRLLDEAESAASADDWALVSSKARAVLALEEDNADAQGLIKTDGLDEVGRERITREAQAMGRLGSHPNVVSIHDIGEERGAPYVVTELLGGGDVESLLAQGPLPLARTLEIAKGVALGLAF